MKEKILKTVIIIGMILSITLANLIVLASDVISYALYDAGKENIEFKIQYENSQKPINSEDIKIKMQVKVKNQGYFNGKIELGNENLKFKQEEVEGVEKITDKEISLKQLNGGETLNLLIGIKVALPEKIEIGALNQESSFNLKGTYTNALKNKSEVEIQEKAKLELTKPELEEESLLEAQIITNKIYKIEEQNKRMIQLQIKSGLNQNGYPIKETTLEIEAPKGVEKAQVIERGTLATNGKEEGKNNNQTLHYETEENNLKIQIKNPEEEGKISYQKQKQDTIIVTYIYNEEKQFQEETIKTKSKILIYDQDQTTYKKEIETKIEEEKEEVINYSINNETNIYKGNLYIGQEQDYKSMSKIDIRYPRNRRKNHMARRKQLLPSKK